MQYCKKKKRGKQPPNPSQPPLNTTVLYTEPTPPPPHRLFLPLLLLPRRRRCRRHRGRLVRLHQHRLVLARHAGHARHARRLGLLRLLVRRRRRRRRRLDRLGCRLDHRPAALLPPLLLLVNRVLDLEQTLAERGVGGDLVGGLEDDLAPVGGEGVGLGVC